MPSFEHTVTFEDVELVRETERAILVKIPELDITTWIPKSQVDDESEVGNEDDVGCLIISRFWAEKESMV